jgi:hypothetical protein
MSQTAISTNGHGTVRSDQPPIAERRHTVVPDPVSPEALVARHIENARRQLAEARENLKASRRRVVQLEDALCNWERFAAEMRRMRGGDPEAGSKP